VAYKALAGGGDGGGGATEAPAVVESE